MKKKIKKEKERKNENRREYAVETPKFRNKDENEDKRDKNR